MLSFNYFLVKNIDKDLRNLSVHIKFGNVNRDLKTYDFFHETSEL